MKPIDRAPGTWPAFLGLVWLAAVAGGYTVIWRYASTPGGSGPAPPRWPEGGRVPLAAEGATLVLLAHPRCPCTRASIEELTRVMELARGRLRAHAVFYQPAGEPDSWSQTPLRRAAAAIPGVSAWSDPGGAEARRFAAETSGQVVLYDARGRLLFSGGITGLRGQAGDNAGRRAVLAGLAGEAAGRAQTAVLGCSLLENDHDKPARTN